MSTMQMSMLIGSILTLVFILRTIKRTRMNIRYAIVWILWSIFMVILSIFPTLIDRLSKLLSIATPVNALFLVLIFALYIIIFYLFIRLSEQSEKIKVLTYEIAELNRNLKKDEK